MPCVQIVSFDIPYPPNYGGVIDVYYKIRALYAEGVEIILHAFDYKGKKDLGDLPSLCRDIILYKRKKGWWYFFHYLPYTVITRKNEELRRNLIRFGAPVIFEVLHTTEPLSDPQVRNLKTLYRHSNLEHRYYYQLAKDEKNVFKKIFYASEALKFLFYEKQIRHAGAIAAVTEKDTLYFQRKFSGKGFFLPSFHPFSGIRSLPGKGDFILFHGNLSVNENENTARWMIKELADRLVHLRFVIAGLNPAKKLIELASRYPNVSVIPNPSESQMQDLIRDAHIHLLLTNNPEGLKLKWLFAFYSGRFIFCSASVLPSALLNVAENNGILPIREKNARTISNHLSEYMNKAFAPEHVIHRKQTGTLFDVATGTSKIMQWLREPS